MTPIRNPRRLTLVGVCGLLALAFVFTVPRSPARLVSPTKTPTPPQQQAAKEEIRSVTDLKKRYKFVRQGPRPTTPAPTPTVTPTDTQPGAVIMGEEDAESAETQQQPAADGPTATPTTSGVTILGGDGQPATEPTQAPAGVTLLGDEPAPPETGEEFPEDEPEASLSEEPAAEPTSEGITLLGDDTDAPAGDDEPTQGITLLGDEEPQPNDGDELRETLGEDEAALLEEALSNVPASGRNEEIQSEDVLLLGQEEPPAEEESDGVDPASYLESGEPADGDPYGEETYTDETYTDETYPDAPAGDYAGDSGVEILGEETDGEETTSTSHRDYERLERLEEEQSPVVMPGEEEFRIRDDDTVIDAEAYDRYSREEVNETGEDDTWVGDGDEFIYEEDAEDDYLQDPSETIDGDYDTDDGDWYEDNFME